LTSVGEDHVYLKEDGSINHGFEIRNPSAHLGGYHEAMERGLVRRRKGPKKPRYRHLRIPYPRFPQGANPAAHTKNRCLHQCAGKLGVCEADSPAGRFTMGGA